MPNSKLQACSSFDCPTRHSPSQQNWSCSRRIRLPS
ncbi:hypothetical protein LINPERHAP2_LOCUS19711 [Linum perenne]